MSAGAARMIAAIYARKSTEQTSATNRNRSRARTRRAQYATRKGWTVDEAYVYVTTGSPAPSSPSAQGSCG